MKKEKKIRVYSHFPLQALGGCGGGLIRASLNESFHKGPGIEVMKSFLASTFYHMSTTPALFALLTQSASKPLSADGASVVVSIFFLSARLSTMLRTFFFGDRVKRETRDARRGREAKGKSPLDKVKSS